MFFYFMGNIYTKIERVDRVQLPGGQVHQINEFSPMLENISLDVVVEGVGSLLGILDRRVCWDMRDLY